jgi:hypothetical protein
MTDPGTHSTPQLRLEARPAQVAVAVYDRLPHPSLGPVQEFVVDLGITADRPVVLTDVVWRAFDRHDRVALVRQRLGREAMERLTHGQYGVAPGLGLALRRCYFLEQGVLPLSRLRVSVAGYDHETRAAASTQLDVALFYHEQRAHLFLPFAEGAWWAISGNDWTGLHKAEPVSWAFAYDFVRLGPDGSFFHGPGLRNEEHHSFNQPVVAPAGGKVVWVRDDMPDQQPGEPLDPTLVGNDQTRIAGNLVVIAHGFGEYSCLAHLRAGSVQVREGEMIKRGQVVGAVGNSGQSPGPHLHYHLQNGPHLFVDQGLPVLFSRFYAAGDLVEQASIPARMIVQPAH